jgi:hypothetical protein
MRKLLQQSPALAEMLRDGGELDEPVGGKAELVAATGTQPPLLRIPPRDWEASRPPGSSARLTQPSSKAPSRSRRALRPSATSRYVLPLLVIDDCGPRVRELETAQVGDVDEHRRAIRIRWTVEKERPLPAPRAAR